MADQIKVMGMVISSSPIGENDKRIVILTKEKGMVSAFARGARRPGNHLMAVSESFVFGTFYLIYGRDSYTLVNAEIKNYFRELAEDITLTYSAYYFMELAQYYAVENQEAAMMLNLLYMSFKALLNPRIDNRLVRYVYELKLLVINGEYPDFFRCALCTTEDVKYFSIKNNGVICGKCKKNVSDIIELSQSALYTLQYIVCADVGKLFTFVVSEDVLSEIRMVMSRCIHTYIDRKMNSLEIIDSLM